MEFVGLSILTKWRSPRTTWNMEIISALAKKVMTWIQAKSRMLDRRVWRNAIASRPAVEEVTG